MCVYFFVCEHSIFKGTPVFPATIPDTHACMSIKIATPSGKISRLIGYSILMHGPSFKPRSNYSAWVLQIS